MLSNELLVDAIKSNAIIPVQLNRISQNPLQLPCLSGFLAASLLSAGWHHFNNSVTIFLFFLDLFAFAIDRHQKMCGRLI